MRRLPHLFGLLSLSYPLLGCGPETAIELGRETGACFEHKCLSSLVCLSDICVDPDATPSADTDSGQDDGDDGDDGDDDGTVGAPPTSVSILVVVDNSGSMGEEQGRIGPALGELAASLTEADIDWRLGVTTSDDSNPWCPGTTPENGTLRLSSCLGRLTQFQFTGAETIDSTMVACLDHCDQATVDVVPTVIEGGSETKRRPWLESIDGTSNLAGGGSMADAIACVAPQGINGCGFEQPLECMYKAIQNAEGVDHPQFGFIPDGALLVVLLVTDEVDCSFNDDQETIFHPDDERTFWGDPDAVSPTSAVCWNAGVRCSGSTCMSANQDPRGNLVDANVADSAAVMFPVSRYGGLMAERSAMVMLIAGSESDGSVTYTRSADAQFFDDFGVGPGCESAGGRALPPVRQREFAAMYPVDGGQTLFSICDSDYGPAMAALSSAIIGRVETD